MIEYVEFLRDPAIFYMALGAFVLAALFDLYLRTKKAGKDGGHRMSSRMEKALAYFKEKKTRKRITNDIYQELTGVSHATAARDLDKLVELGLLERQGRTSTTHYRVVSSKK